MLPSTEKIIQRKSFDYIDRIKNSRNEQRAELDYYSSRASGANPQFSSIITAERAASINNNSFASEVIDELIDENKGLEKKVDLLKLKLKTQRETRETRETIKVTNWKKESWKGKKWDF